MSVYCAMMKALQQHQHIWEINIQEPSSSSSCRSASVTEDCLVNI
jgi:hypothetical protein